MTDSTPTDNRVHTELIIPDPAAAAAGPLPLSRLLLQAGQPRIG
jgi:hypothetical protein